MAPSWSRIDWVSVPSTIRTASTKSASVDAEASFASAASRRAVQFVRASGGIVGSSASLRTRASAVSMASAVSARPIWSDSRFSRSSAARRIQAPVASAIARARGASPAARANRTRSTCSPMSASTQFAGAARSPARAFANNAAAWPAIPSGGGLVAAAGAASAARRGLKASHSCSNSAASAAPGGVFDIASRSSVAFWRAEAMAADAFAIRRYDRKATPRGKRPHGVVDVLVNRGDRVGAAGRRRIADPFGVHRRPFEQRLARRFLNVARAGQQLEEADDAQSKDAGKQRPIADSPPPRPESGSQSQGRFRRARQVRRGRRRVGRERPHGWSPRRSRWARSVPA